MRNQHIGINAGVHSATILVSITAKAKYFHQKDSLKSFLQYSTIEENGKGRNSTRARDHAEVL